MRIRATPKSDPRRGAALISALGISLTIAGIAIFMIRMSSDALFAERMATERFVAEMVLESVLAETLFSLGQQPPAAERFLAEPFLVSTDQGEVTVMVTSPHARIDLNTASPFVLTTLISAAGASDDEATALADAIADWRDPDDLTRLNGAERDDYSRAGLDGPDNDVFRRIETLREVIGMTPELADCLEGHLTIASNRSAPALETATNWLNEAFDSTASADANLPPLRLTVGEAYEITLQHTRPSGSSYELFAVVRLSGDRRDPVWLHERQFGTVQDRSDWCPPMEGRRLNG